MLTRRLFIVKCGFIFSTFPSMIASEQNRNFCGMPVSDDRVFSNWGGRVTNQILKLILISIEKHKSNCILRIRTYVHDKEQFFFSTDNGKNWHTYNSKVSSYGNLNILSLYKGVSNNTRTLFWNDFNNTIVNSTNEGESWEPIAFHSNVTNKISQMSLVSISAQNDSRVYAWIHFTDNNKDDGIYQINDNGKNIVKIADNLVYFVESRANPRILIGLTQANQTPHHEIAISKDGGITWNKVKHDIITNFIYRDRKTDITGTIRKSHDDREQFISRPVVQIETDPVDQESFYVVTGTGVFVTNNLGDSFKLLPISHEYLYSVDAIAVNPLDGRHIFAAIKGEDLYHSDDRGCTWEKLMLPTV